MIKFILIKIITSILWLIDHDHRITEKISMNNIKKFTHIQDQDFASDFGLVTKSYRTVPYTLWELKTTTKELLAADKHRVINEHHCEVWLEDLVVGDKIFTDAGLEVVTSIKNLGIKTHMYCLEVNTSDVNDSNNHLFYTNGVLSHNTTCAAGYILWKTMFNSDTGVLIVANQQNQAIEILDRIKFAYENLEHVNWIRSGVLEYNKTSITFDNGSSITCRATTPNAARGLSISLLYCLSGTTFVAIRDKDTLEEKVITLKELYSMLED